MTQKQKDRQEEDDDLKTVKVAMLPFSWGKAENPRRDIQAVQNAVKNWFGDGVSDEGTVKLRLYEVTEDFEISGMGGIRASEIVDEEVREVDAELLEKISDIQADLECLIENLMMDEEPTWDFMNEVVK